MTHDFLPVALSTDGERVLDLVKTDRRRASQIMAALSREEQVNLVSYQAQRDPKAAEDLLFLLKDDESTEIIDDMGDRSIFRIMKSQSSTHIGILSLMDPNRVQAILDLDPELFSTKGLTDDQTAYHWMISFLEEDDAAFALLLKHLDIKVIASAFQAKLRPPSAVASETLSEETATLFPADFMVKLDRGELKPDDLEVTDEEARDILTKIHLVDEAYFTEVVSLMIREKDLMT